jgi:hypothetical protein
VTGRSTGTGATVGIAVGATTPAEDGFDNRPLLPPSGGESA